MSWLNEPNNDTIVIFIAQELSIVWVERGQGCERSSINIFVCPLSTTYEINWVHYNPGKSQVIFMRFRVFHLEGGKVLVSSSSSSWHLSTWKSSTIVLWHFNLIHILNILSCLPLSSKGTMGPATTREDSQKTWLSTKGQISGCSEFTSGWSTKRLEKHCISIPGPVS